MEMWAYFSPLFTQKHGYFNFIICIINYININPWSFPPLNTPFFQNPWSLLPKMPPFLWKSIDHGGDYKTLQSIMHTYFGIERDTRDMHYNYKLYTIVIREGFIFCSIHLSVRPALSWLKMILERYIQIYLLFLYYKY